MRSNAVLLASLSPSQRDSALRVRIKEPESIHRLCDGLELH